MHYKLVNKPKQETMNLENLNLVELNAQEQKETEGGFVPLVIWGIALTAEAVAGGAVAAFASGVAIGAAAYLTGR